MHKRESNMVRLTKETRDWYKICEYSTSEQSKLRIHGEKITKSLSPCRVWKRQGTQIRRWRVTRIGRRRTSFWSKQSEIWTNKTWIERNEIPLSPAIGFLHCNWYRSPGKIGFSDRGRVRFVLRCLLVKWIHLQIYESDEDFERRTEVEKESRNWVMNCDSPHLHSAKAYN